MGKAALLITIFTLVGVSVMYTTESRSSMDRMAQEADYQAEVLAREAAQSAFNIVGGKVVRDFNGYRTQLSDLSYKEARYDMSAADGLDGVVDITGTGRYGDHEFTIEGVVERPDRRLFDALMVVGPVKKVRLDGTATVTGIDTNPDGSAGEGPDVHGVLISDPDGMDDVNIGGTSDVLGAGGTDDIVNEAPIADLDIVEADILSYAGPLLTLLIGDQSFNGGTFGLPGVPAIMRVEGDVKLSGNFSGYGILYTTGEFEMSGDASWTGLIIANTTDSGIRHEIKGSNATIYGSLVVRSDTEEVEVKTSGTPEIIYSSQALRMLEPFVPMNEMMKGEPVVRRRSTTPRKLESALRAY